MSLEIYDKVLPKGFEFPEEFIAIVERNHDIMPWRFFANDNFLDLHKYFVLLRDKYPQGCLIPFAYIHDLSGFWEEGWPVIANFDPNSGNTVRIYAAEISHSSPWVNKGFANFVEWLGRAERESAIYKAEIAELESYSDK